MELYEAMRCTFAARQYTGEELSDEVLMRVLDNARFAPSGGNRQGGHVVIVRDQSIKEELAALAEPAAKRYLAQINNGESPWNSLSPPGIDPATIEATVAPPMLVEPFRTASAVLVVCVDLGVVASMDQDLDRVGIVSGASIYPLVWNILMAARAVHDSGHRQGGGGSVIAKHPIARCGRRGHSAWKAGQTTYAIASASRLGLRHPRALRRTGLHRLTASASWMRKGLSRACPR